MRRPTAHSRLVAGPWLLLVLLAGCAPRNYTYYLVDPAPQKHPALKDDGTITGPLASGPPP